jgi:hypothetical protein
LKISGAAATAVPHFTGSMKEAKLWLCEDPA